MPTPLRITATLVITPLLDIQHEEVATAYRQGVSDGLRHHDEPVSVCSLFTSLKRATACGVFDGQHDAEARDFVGFHLGCIHGAILTAYGTHRSGVTTLATLDSKDTRRGYDVGREWFFLESDPDERCFHDVAPVRRFIQLVQDEAEFPSSSSDKVWLYTLACIVGELSGLMFPASQQERARWEYQNALILAEQARRESEYRRDTEPLPVHPAS